MKKLPPYLLCFFLVNSYAQINYERACQKVLTESSLTKTAACTEGASYCIDLPLNQVSKFDFFLDGLPYQDNLEGCRNDSVYSYTYFPIPDRGDLGPYSVEEWKVGDTIFTGEFATIADLVDSMNVWCPTSDWILDENRLMIEGGRSDLRYSALKIVQVNTNATATLELNTNLIPNGTILRIPVGIHTLVIADKESDCADTLQAVIICQECPELYTGSTDLLLDNCDSTYNLCMNIDPSTLNNFEIVLNGEMHLPELCTPDTLYTYSIFSIPGEGEIGPYTFDWSINGESLTGTFDSLTQLVGELNKLDGTDVWGSENSLFTITGGRSGTMYGELQITQTNTGEVGDIGEGQIFASDRVAFSLGVGINSMKIKNLITDCDFNYDFIVECNTATISEKDIVLPIAGRDDTLTMINKTIVIDLLGNDTINGVFIDVGIVDLPTNGTAFINPNRTLSYVPNTDFCSPSPDTFSYFIQNTAGLDTATVSISTLCAGITIFSGISPNGDGVNDKFTILGIEGFPNNEVSIYNRWGNRVFQTKGYTNAEAWDGMFDRGFLPDGTYFYVIDLGDASKPLSGYVHINR